jgi:hypothetical protein
MANKNSYAVAVVVDKNFGERLLELSSRLPVWICSSTQNLKYVKEIWSKTKEENLKRVVTSFNFKENDSLEDIFLGILDNVDLHHGEFSHNPAWNVLEVYGLEKVSNKILNGLKKYGEGIIKETTDGFIYFRENGERTENGPRERTRLL